MTSVMLVIQDAVMATFPCFDMNIQTGIYEYSTEEPYWCDLNIQPANHIDMT